LSRVAVGGWPRSEYPANSLGAYAGTTPSTCCLLALAPALIGGWPIQASLLEWCFAWGLQYGAGGPGLNIPQMRVPHVSHLRHGFGGIRRRYTLNMLPFRFQPTDRWSSDPQSRAPRKAVKRPKSSESAQPPDNKPFTPGELPWRSEAAKLLSLN
jgi:hypothetical protein